MPILSTHSGPKYSEWSKSTSQSLEGKQVTNYTRVFQVACNAVDGEDYAEAQCPYAIGNVIGRARCYNVDTTAPVEWQSNGVAAVVYRCQFDFSTEAPEYPNPLDVAQHHVPSVGRLTRATLKDADDVPLKNVNGEPIEGEEVEVFYTVHTITKNRPASRYNELRPLFGKLNSATFEGKEPKSLRFVDYQVSDVQEVEVGNTTVSFVTETIVIEEAPDGETWEAKPLNRGFMAKPDAGAETKPVRIIDANKQEITSPRLLAEDGTELPEDGEPYFIPDVYLYKDASFSSLDVTIP